MTATVATARTARRGTGLLDRYTVTATDPVTADDLVDALAYVPDDAVLVDVDRDGHALVLVFDEPTG